MKLTIQEIEKTEELAHRVFQVVQEYRVGHPSLSNRDVSKALRMAENDLVSEIGSVKATVLSVVATALGLLALVGGLALFIFEK